MSNTKPKSYEEAQIELRQSIRVLAFEIAKLFGIIWLIGKLPFLDYKDWVKAQLKENK